MTVSQCVGFFDQRPEFLKKRDGFRGRLVHLPIARHDWFVHKICLKKLSVSDGHFEIFGHGLADIGEGRAYAEVAAPPRLRTEDHQRHVLAAVIRSGVVGSQP